MTEQTLTGAQLRKLKARAQHLEPVAKVGKQGVSTAFVQSLVEIFGHHELIKIKFVEFKEQKKELAPEIAAKTGSHFIWMVGNVAVYFRENPDPQRRKIFPVNTVSPAE